MGLRWPLIIISVIAAGAGTLGLFGQAFASHDFQVLAVRSANAYRHVLETDDRLVLVQYAIREEPTTGESAYGVTGAILDVSLGATVLDQQTPPTPGYAIAAFYWPAASSSTVPWADATADANIQANPLLFTAPQTASLDLTWNSTDSATGTASELATDLKVILQSIEQDNPDVSTRQYVSTSGITPAGAGLVTAAFPQLLTIAPGAFEVSVSAVGEDLKFDTLTPGGAAAPEQVESFIGAVGSNQTTATVTLSASHFYSTTQSMTVLRLGGHGEVTSGCTLGADRKTLTCAGLTPDPDPTDLTVHYFSSTQGLDSEFTQGWMSFWLAWGVPFNASRLILLAVIMGTLAAAVVRTGGEPLVLLIFVGSMLFWSGEVGALPRNAVYAILALVMLAGSAATFNRILR